MMNVEEVKRDKEFYKRFIVQRKNLWSSQMIRALSGSILDLSSRLEAIEGVGDVRPKIQMERREASMQRLKWKI